MLLRKNRRRNEIDNLFALLNRLKCRTQGNLRLAITDIPTNQTIHNLMALHVALRVLDRRELIVRLLIREKFLKFSLPHRVRSINKSIRILSRRIELD